MVDPNGLAAVFSLGLFLSAKDFLNREIPPGWTQRIILFLLLGGLIVAGSRGAFLALALMGAFMLGVYGLRRIGKKTWIHFILIAFAALGVTILMMPGLHEGPLLMISSIVRTSVSATLENRFDIWAAAVTMIKAHPWFGTGIGTFYNYYPEVRPVDDTTAGYMAHNDPLQFGVEMGVGGLLLFYVVVGLAVKRTITAMRRLSNDDSRRLEILAPACGLGALVLHAHLTFNFHVLPCLMLAGFTFALWHKATELALEESPRVVTAPRRFNDFSLQIIFLLVAFVMSVLAAAPVYTQRLVASATQALNQGDLRPI